jgi:hypothetical protein
MKYSFPKGKRNYSAYQVSTTTYENGWSHNEPKPHSKPIECEKCCALRELKE